MINGLIQSVIVVLGTTAVYLHGCEDPKVKRWGLVVALASEPFWLWQAVDLGAWGVAVMCGVFTVGWLRGIHNHFGRGSE